MMELSCSSRVLRISPTQGFALYLIFFPDCFSDSVNVAEFLCLFFFSFLLDEVGLVFIESVPSEDRGCEWIKPLSIP